MPRLRESRSSGGAKNGGQVLLQQRDCPRVNQATMRPTLILTGTASRFGKREAENELLHKLDIGR